MGIGLNQDEFDLEIKWAERRGLEMAARLFDVLTKGYYDHAKAPYIRYRDAIIAESEKLPKPDSPSP